MFNLFMSGVVVGLVAVLLPLLIIVRCRFGVHKWNRWLIAADGGSQYRTCRKCNYYSVEMFRDFRVTVKAPVSAEAPHV